MHVWLDVENPPQVQYLMPLAPAFEAAGATVVVTARDYGDTFDLLDATGIAYDRVGEQFGKSRRQKLVGVTRRTAQLLWFFRGRPRPALLVHAGRASALAARVFGAASFSVWDYEHADISFDRLARSFIVYPEVIDAHAFTRRGIREDRLLPFAGLKEDLSFADVDVGAIPPHEFPELAGNDRVRVLFRPPAEESHYYREASGDLSLELLGWLAGREDVVVVFAPRYPRQAEQLERFRFANEPVLLRAPVAFVSLLKGVDAVVSSGGTMIREAAYVGVPAYSIFRGEIGDVDRHLASIDRLTFVSARDDFDRIRLERAAAPALLRAEPGLRERLVASMLERAGAGR